MSLFPFEHYFPTRIKFELGKKLDLKPYLKPERKTLLVISESLHQLRPQIFASLPEGSSIYYEVGSNPTLQHLKENPIVCVVRFYKFGAFNKRTKTIHGLSNSGTDY